MPAFVFLELADRDLNFLFRGIYLAIAGALDNRPAHLTLRGPYAGAVPPGTVQRCREQMKNEVLTIGGVGRFENRSEHVVYLAVRSPRLRSVWWKPDYPIGTYGFNPHLTLYRGTSTALATAVERFFLHEDLKAHCAEYRIVSVLTKQEEMLMPRVPVTLYPFHEHIDGKIRPNLLSRLEMTVNRARRLEACAGPDEQDVQFGDG